MRSTKKKKMKAEDSDKVDGSHDDQRSVRPENLASEDPTIESAKLPDDVESAKLPDTGTHSSTAASSSSIIASNKCSNVENSCFLSRAMDSAL